MLCYKQSIKNVLLDDQNFKTDLHLSESIANPSFGKGLPFLDRYPLLPVLKLLPRRELCEFDLPSPQTVL